VHTSRQVCGTHRTCRMSNFVYVYEFCEIPTRNRCRRLCRQISPGLYIIIIFYFLSSIIFYPRRSAQFTLAPVIAGVRRAKFSSNFRDGGDGKGRTRDLEWWRKKPLAEHGAVKHVIRFPSLCTIFFIIIILCIFRCLPFPRERLYAEVFFTCRIVVVAATTGPT